MRFLILSFLLFTFIYADLGSKITSNAQMACYLKNPSNGLSASDYSPIVAGQTLIQSIESAHTSTQSEATCNNWLLDPYVNVDVELYNVIADMDCTVNSEDIEVGDVITTYYWTVINQYSLTIDCQSSCDIPRDSSGNIYDFTPYINESDCTVSNLQQLLLTEDPNSLYIINDAQYLNCPTNVNLTGCFYKKNINFDTNTTDTNNTDINTTNSTDTNQLIDVSSITNAINDIKNLNEGELNNDASFLDTYKFYFDELNQSIQIIENNINELKDFIDMDYTPQFQYYNSCVIYFTIYNTSKSFNMCLYAPILRPFFTFSLTIAMLVLLIRLHFYLFPKVYKGD